jgi:hypothetical protein
MSMWLESSTSLPVKSRIRRPGLGSYTPDKHRGRDLRSPNHLIGQ